MSQYKTCPECGGMAYCMLLTSDPPQEQWRCTSCKWKSEPVRLWENQDASEASTLACCADCGIEYGTFPDMILPDDVWARIAPREGKYGILCPTCIAKRLDKIGLWYQDGYYNHKGWSALNPLGDTVDALRTGNAQLQDELATLRSENAMLRKMQPVTLNGEAARSFALAAELSATKQQLAHMTGAYDTQVRVHDKLNRDYIAVRDELDGLRADIEAGRMVRLPAAIGEVVFCPSDDGGVFFPYIKEIAFLRPNAGNAVMKAIAHTNMGDLEYLIAHENEGSEWFRTEQAARAAKED
jgi:hypothetical protein